MAVTSTCPTSSRVWSCATLRDGVEDVASKQRDMEREEQELERQIEELEKEEYLLNQLTLDQDQEQKGSMVDDSAHVQHLQGQASPQEETQKATDEELQAAGLPPQDQKEILNGEPTRPVATPARLAHDGADHSKPAEPEIVASPKVPEAGPSAESATAPSKDGTKRLRTRQERLREAAKQRIRRMIQHHKRPHLNVPQFVIDEWKTRDQNTVAQILMDANWDKATFVAQLEVIVTKKKTVSVRVEEQWMTEKEMKSELQWTPARIAGAKKTCEAKGESHCRKNAYDGEQEYYIVTKEVGARQEERTQEEIHRSQKKADDGPTLDKDAFDGLAKAAARKAADDADADPNNPGGTGGSQIHETKSTFTKFMQSMLQKSGKIRSLVRELKEKYANCDTTSENVNLLQTGLKTMDEEYDKCSNLMVCQEGQQAHGRRHLQVSSTFFRGSSICATEMKVRNAKKYEKRDKHTDEQQPKKPKRSKKEKDGKGKRNHDDDDEDAPEPKTRKSKKIKNEK